MTGFEQGQVERRPVVGYDQPGQAPAAAEVEHPAALRQPGEETPAVFDLAVHRAGTEKPERLGPEEDGGKVGVRQEEEPGWLAELAKALMTTRRRGSSPSETVATPSISLTMSWTILRSTGDIGSKT